MRALVICDRVLVDFIRASQVTDQAAFIGFLSFSGFHVPAFSLAHVHITSQKLESTFERMSHECHGIVKVSRTHVTNPRAETGDR